MSREEKKAVASRCVHCGREFYRDLFVNAARKYCSPGCATAAKAKRLKQRHPNSGAWERTERICINCGKRFMARPDGKYCNRKCLRAWWQETVRLGLEVRARQKEAPENRGEMAGRPKEEGATRISAAKKAPVSARSSSGTSRSTPPRSRTARR